MAKVRIDDRCGGAEGIQARSFVVLQLEEFQHFGVLLRGGHEMEVPVLVGENQTHDAGAGEFGGAQREHVQEVEEVEVVDEGIRDFDEDLSKPLR
jgi:hypothetical protein